MRWPLGYVAFTLGFKAWADPVVPVVDVFAQTEGGYFCIKIPSITTLPDNSLMALGEARFGDCGDFTKTDLVMKTSRDGITWSPLRVLHTGPGAADTVGNAAPVVVDDREHQISTIVVPFCVNNSKVLITRSHDLGKTWTPATDITENATLPAWKWVGLGPPAGLQLRSGRLVIPSYHTVVDPAIDDGLVSKGHALLSDDHGMSWRLSSDRDYGGDYLPNEAQAVELSRGRVASFSRLGIVPKATTYSYKRVRSVSSDGGEHWEKTELLETLDEPWAGCQGSTISCPLQSNLYGRLVYAGPVNPGQFRTMMSIYTSDDEGATWQNHSLVDPGSSGYASLAWLQQRRQPRRLALLYERSQISKGTTTLPTHLSLATLPDPCTAEALV